MSASVARVSVTVLSGDNGSVRLRAVIPGGVLDAVSDGSVLCFELLLELSVCRSTAVLCARLRLRFVRVRCVRGLLRPACSC